MDELKLDKKSLEQWLGNNSEDCGSGYDEMIEMLVDIFNGDYTIEAFKNDIMSYYEPDDRGDINR